MYLKLHVHELGAIHVALKYNTNINLLQKVLAGELNSLKFYNLA